MTVTDFLREVTEEIEAFVDAPVKKEYAVLRCEELFDRYFQPVDLPGPDGLIDPLLRSAIRPLIERIYDEVLSRINKEKE